MGEVVAAAAEVERRGDRRRERSPSRPVSAVCAVAVRVPPAGAAIRTGALPGPAGTRWCGDPRRPSPRGGPRTPAGRRRRRAPCRAARRAWPRSPRGPNSRRRPLPRGAGPPPPGRGRSRSRAGGPSSASASAASPRSISRRASASVAAWWSGSSSRAWRNEASSPAATRVSASLGAGARRCTKAVTWASGRAPMNWSTTWPSRMAKTAGIDCTWKASAIRGFSSTLTLASSTAPPVSATAFSSIGTERRARPAPRGPQVDDDGHRRAAVQHVGLECLVGDVHRPDANGCSRDGRTVPGRGRQPAPAPGTGGRRRAAPGVCLGRAAPISVGSHVAGAGGDRRGQRHRVDGRPPARAHRPADLHPDRRRPLQPHLPGRGRRGAGLGPAPAAAAPRAAHGARHVARVPPDALARARPGSRSPSPSASAPTSRSTSAPST